MTDELKPVRCGCGGKPYLKYDDGAYSIMCTKCGIETKGYCDHFDDFRSAKEYATRDWNKAMGERTAKVTTVEKPVVGCDKKITVTSCGNCETAVSLFDNYCYGCGCRLIWRED